MTPIRIIHEEKHFVVCIKPHGILSEASDSKALGMVDLLSEQLNCDIYPVHRLDREACGVMVYAKNKVGAAKLSVLMQTDGFDKEYIVLVHGKPECDEGVFEDYLFKDSKKNKSFVVKKERKGVKFASLEYKTLETKTVDDKTLSLVSVKLHTGRTHQIRVQFSSRKMPVAGDSRYGSCMSGNMQLFSCRIGFVNPFTSEYVSFEDKDLFRWEELSDEAV